MEALRNKKSRRRSAVILAAGLAYFMPVSAQYFGQNKPSYRSFGFRVTQTPHFEIYHYLENDSLLQELAMSAEQWYARHQKVLRDTFTLHNPVLFYNSHADFQQTNAISGSIGSGTGGVTESMKNRVIMPMAHTLSQTDHVLGHELVHAFQFHMLTRHDSVRGSIRNLPLWMIEGMAEYLSIGSLDPHTSMWMRDALLNRNFPTLEKVNKDARYFPYRYGQAFWATVGKTWGDSLIMPLFMETARSGYETALDSILGVNEETFSGMWKSAMEVHYGDYLVDSIENPAGRPVLTGDNAGRMNISPSLSPDGRYIAFISEKDLFTLDLFLYDIGAGKITRKLASTVRHSEIDDFNFMESAGTWSPDGKQFAFVVFSQGKSRLMVVDSEKGKIIREMDIPGLDAFIHPAWSPDGRQIVVSGLKDGIGDLYLYDLRDGNLRRLTSDRTSDIHPSWSSDGRYIAYAAEKENNIPGSRRYTFGLAMYDLTTGLTRKLDVFPGAYNMNPVFGRGDLSLYFLSDRDGFRNLYNIDLKTGRVFRLTDLMTGISGITTYSPAISLATGSGQLAYSYYGDKTYKIYLADSGDFERTEVDPLTVYMDAGTLPPLNHVSANLVDTLLYHRNFSADTLQVREVPYRPRFRIDHISNITAGVSSGRYGTGMAGSVNAIFSDISGDHQLYASLAANGEIWDFGGQVAYINSHRKINWGAVISHIPYQSGYTGYRRDTITIDGEEMPVHNYQMNLVRMFEDNISLFSFYPISRTRRIEAGASLGWYNYRIDRYNNYYTEDLFPVGGTREKIPAPEGFNLQKFDLAYVEDNSHFGMTSPMQGHRSRIQAQKHFGAVGFTTVLVDHRKYFYLKPVNLSFRFYHYGRYGKDAENDLVSPLYLGYPWLIRGYEGKNLSAGDAGLNFSHLTGSKILVTNAELRLPLTGPEQLALIRSRVFYTDINLFFDAGLAWSAGRRPELDWQPGESTLSIPVFSTGASLRINLFGYMVIEPFYAFPFQNGGWKNGVFGVNFTPGW